MNFIELKPGSSVEGDSIMAYKSDKKCSKYIYLIAGIHGDEVESVYLLDNLFNWLKEDDELDLALIVIPNLNVDGHRAGTRVNSHGVDLNRNFPAKSWKKGYKSKRYFPGTEPLSEPESQYASKLFSKYPPKFVIAFHSWRPFINFNGDCRELAELMAKHNSYPIEEHIADHPTPGSLGEYVPEAYGAPILTLESPVLDEGIELKEIWSQNEKALKKLLSCDQFKS